MTNPRRQPRDFLWPVPPSDLEDIEVLEEPFQMTGAPRWRRREAAYDTLANSEEDTAADDALPVVALIGSPSREPAAVPDRPRQVWHLALSSAWQRLEPTEALRGWFGAAERVGLVVAGVLIGVVIALFGLPNVDRNGTPTAVPGGSAPRSAARAALTSAEPPPKILGVQLPRPSTTRAGVGLAAPATGVPAHALAVTPPAAPAAPRSSARTAAATPSPRPAPAAPRTRPTVVPLTVRTTPASVPPAPSRAAPTTPADAAPREAPAVLGPVQDYAVAWSRLDARATQAVFPSVDRDQLVARFTGIREQRLTLGGCTTAVNGTEAQVTCRGTLRYRPRVGDHTTRVEQSRWRFALRSDSGKWVITSVDPS